ncbi:MAG: asparagine synthetase B, partial [Rhodospirillales bacterium]|nr:asparagine synthetase B [Rhodospirillales bacterium]
MCGIAGVMTRAGGAPDTVILDGLAKSLTHRGPDGEGRFNHGESGLGLVHRRLAIIDLETGDQPFISDGGNA